MMRTWGWDDEYTLSCFQQNGHIIVSKGISYCQLVSRDLRIGIIGEILVDILIIVFFWFINRKATEFNNTAAGWEVVDKRRRGQRFAIEQRDDRK